MKVKLLLSPVIVILLGGCCWFLPAGDPPQGNILDNTLNNTGKTYTAREAVDYMISALTMAYLERCPGAKVVLSYSRDEFADAAARIIMNESGKITGNQLVNADSEWVLRPERTGNQLTLTLLCHGREVWRETVRYQIN